MSHKYYDASSALHRLFHLIFWLSVYGGICLLIGVALLYASASGPKTSDPALVGFFMLSGCAFPIVLVALYHGLIFIKHGDRIDKAFRRQQQAKHEQEELRKREHHKERHSRLSDINSRLEELTIASAEAKDEMEAQRLLREFKQLQDEHRNLNDNHERSLQEKHTQKDEPDNSRYFKITKYWENAFIPTVILIVMFFVGYLKTNYWDSGENPKTLKTTNQKLAWAYESEALSISNHDALTLLRWGETTQEWNLASAPIIRDLLDQSVSAEDFMETSSRQLLKLKSVVFKMVSDVALIEDGGVRKTLAPLVEHHKAGITLYDQLHQAVVNNDVGEEQEVIKKISKWGQDKLEMSSPIGRKLSQVIPANIIDETLRKMQQEVIKELKP